MSDSHVRGSSTPVPDRDPGQLVAGLRRALTRDSYHMHGSVTMKGAPVVLDVDYGPSHSRFAAANSEGTLDAGGLALRFVNHDGHLWLRAPEHFWAGVAATLPDSVQLSSEQITKLARRWVRLTDNGALYEQLVTATQKSFLVATLFPANPSGDGSVDASTSPGRTVHGVATTHLSGYGRDLYISDVDGTLLLESGQGGTITFSRYGAVGDPAAPPVRRSLDGQPLGI